MSHKLAIRLRSLFRFFFLQEYFIDGDVYFHQEALNVWLSLFCLMLRLSLRFRHCHLVHHGFRLGFALSVLSRQQKHCIDPLFHSGFQTSGNAIISFLFLLIFFKILNENIFHVKCLIYLRYNCKTKCRWMFICLILPVCRIRSCFPSILQKRTVWFLFMYPYEFMDLKYLIYLNVLS